MSTTEMRTLVWSSFETPVGTLVAVATPTGVAALGFDDEERVVERTERARGTPARRDDPALSSLRDEVDAYFAGELRTFESQPDLDGLGGFVRRVLDEARRIPFGAVASYGELAIRAGSPRAQRAAGSAMARNPVQFLVPCHRVLPADGSLGGYSGREDRKAFLLDHEAAVIAAAPGSSRTPRRPRASD